MTHNVAILSLHTSPLMQPGAGDSGGMNVYVREMAAALAHAGCECRVYVRRSHHGLPDEVAIEPGVTVVHIDAGSPDLRKEELFGVLDQFADGVLSDFRRHRHPDVIHANYWLSGVAGHRVKHVVEVPLAVTFHTLARVKAATGDPESEHRAQAETEVIGCADAVIASCEPEAQQLREFYDAPPERIEFAPPGVEHALFSPGDREGARTALGLGRGPVLLFVGRIQPLKRPLVAVETLARLAREDARLLVVGGPSGTEGEDEYQRLQDRIHTLGLEEQVTLVPPRPHHWLSTYYRAADVVLVPSRSESFGLVALEAAASGTPGGGRARGRFALDRGPWPNRILGGRSHRRGVRRSHGHPYRQPAAGRRDGHECGRASSFVFLGGHGPLVASHVPKGPVPSACLLHMTPPMACNPVYCT